MKKIAEQLQQGKKVTFNPRGNSMMPRVKSGQEVTVVPLNNDFSSVQVGDVVLCKVKGNYYLHLVLAKDQKRGFQIGNNKGFINGWTHTLYGIALV